MSDNASGRVWWAVTECGNVSCEFEMPNGEEFKLIISPAQAERFAERLKEKATMARRHMEKIEDENSLAILPGSGR